MPTNNIVKPINPNRFGPQPGGSLINRAAQNPAQQTNRPGPMGSGYLTTSMVGSAAPMIKVNGRIGGNNVTSWNYTPNNSLGSTQNITTARQQQLPFIQYPSPIHTLHPQHHQQSDMLDLSEFPALGSSSSSSSSNTNSNNITTNHATTNMTTSSNNIPPPTTLQQQQMNPNGSVPFSEQEKKMSILRTMDGNNNNDNSNISNSNNNNSNSSSNGTVVSSGQSMNPTTSTSVTTSIDGYGLLGLLNVIRMTDPDLNMLSLGSDLTSLGLNLNSSDPLYATFSSPWADNNQTIGLIEPEYHLPACYNVQPPPPAQQKIHLFSDETLFYIFYSMPKDFLQEAAAYELFNRNWRFHKDLKLWLTKEKGAEPFSNESQQFERGTFIFFDPNTWEKFPREFVLMHDSLEDRPQIMTITNMGSNASTSSIGGLVAGPPPPSSLQQLVAPPFLRFQHNLS